MGKGRRGAEEEGVEGRGKEIRERDGFDEGRWLGHREWGNDRGGDVRTRSVFRGETTYVCMYVDGICGISVPPYATPP